MSSNTVINSVEFTDEQKEYLRGFFAGVSQRGLIPFVGHTADGRITNDPATELDLAAEILSDAGTDPAGFIGTVSGSSS